MNVIDELKIDNNILYFLTGMKESKIVNKPEGFDELLNQCIELTKQRTVFPCISRVGLGDIVECGFEKEIVEKFTVFDLAFISSKLEEMYVENGYFWEDLKYIVNEFLSGNYVEDIEKLKSQCELFGEDSKN